MVSMLGYNDVMAGTIVVLGVHSMVWHNQDNIKF